MPCLGGKGWKMKTASAGKELIKHFESCRLKAYPDPGTGGAPWTIGWGHTKGVKQGDTCTLAQADAWFDEDLEEHEGYVNQLVQVPITQNQFDALVSFCYNVGPDIDADTIAEGLGDSTLLKKLNAGDYAGAADEFRKWTRSGGRVMPGLIRRREMERELFLRA